MQPLLSCVEALCTGQWTSVDGGMDEFFREAAKELGLNVRSREFAQSLDSKDQLGFLREQFDLPQHEGEAAVYLLGNSLGPKPKAVTALVEEELEVWAEAGNRGHFQHPHGRDWLTADEACVELLLPLVGAKRDEVAVMGTLTGNLHHLMCAFYRPRAERFKIVIEEHAFPSDHYAIESQLRMHEFDPAEAMIILKASTKDGLFRTEDVMAMLHQQGPSIALVLLGGVHYYTGQQLDMAAITHAGHDIGAIVGFDLAHAVGNIPLKLHEWGVDFASWCSYKYLNSGPGGIAGIFVHESRHDKGEETILRGWWSHRKETRFAMTNKLDPIRGAGGFRVSNPCILAVTAHLASLQVFAQTTIEELRRKSHLLTEYMRLLLSDFEGATIITPRGYGQSGAQLSLRLSTPGAAGSVAETCAREGVMLDSREPDVLRLALTGMFNTFEDVCRASQVIKTAIAGRAEPF